MTVETLNITSGPYVGTNLLDTYEYDFRITDESELLVYETDDLGVQTTLVLNTDYTVTGVGVDGGGTVVRTAGNLPTDYIWYVRSNYAETQLTAFGSQGAFFPGIHEDAFDLVTFLIQQLRDTFTRSFKLADSIDIDGDFELSEDATVRLNKILGFDSSGDLTTVTLNDEFITVYLGSKTADPTLDNQGNALIDGALYYNTTSNIVRVYDLGTTSWITVNPSNTASDITVVDTGDRFTGTDVEAVLAEIYDYTRPRWINAVQVGSDLNLASVFSVKLAALNGTDVALIDGLVKNIQTYRFDYTAGTWSAIGSGLNIPGISSSSICALNETDIAYIDSTNDDLRVYRFNGSTWSQVGNDLNITFVTNPTITTIDTNTVAFIDDFNHDLRTYAFDGTDWAQVGNDLYIVTNTSSPSITALSNNTIAFIDGLNDKLRTYTFDGTDWAQIGNDLSISGGLVNISITALNNDTIAYIDGQNEDLRTYTFDGTDWAQVGTDLNISGAVSSPVITTLNGTDIAYFDNGNLDLRTYRFAFHIGPDPYRP